MKGCEIRIPPCPPPPLPPPPNTHTHLQVDCVQASPEFISEG